MQLELAKIGTVRSDVRSPLSTYGQLSTRSVQETFGRATLGAEVISGAMGSSSLQFCIGIAATTVSLHFKSLTAAAIAIHKYVIVEPDMSNVSVSSPKVTRGREKVIRNAILEMRPTRRSLRDKAREELSEFEREYPW